MEPYFFTVEPEDAAYISDPSNYPLRSASWNLQSNTEDTWLAGTDLRMDARPGAFATFFEQNRGKGEIFQLDEAATAYQAVDNDSEVTVPGREEKLHFFGQSGRAYNLVACYQRGPIELRAAWTYRAEYLNDVGAEAFQDRYADDRAIIDLSGRLRLPGERLELFAQARNLTNEPEVGYQGIRSRYYVHTLTGRTYTLGPSGNF